jgi:hypothetical protein
LPYSLTTVGIDSDRGTAPAVVRVVVVIEQPHRWLGGALGTAAMAAGRTSQSGP